MKICQKSTKYQRKSGRAKRIADSLSYKQYIYTEGSVGQVGTIMAMKINQTRLGQTREEQVNWHTRDQDFKIKQEDNKHN